MTRQAYNYTCGVAAVQAVLGYFGDQYNESSLYPELAPSPDDGTCYHTIITFLQNQRYKLEVFAGHRQGEGMTIEQVKSYIDKGMPVIALIQAYRDDPNIDYSTDWNDGHYVVAIGYNKDNIIFMDPSTLGNYTYISQEEFLKRWHDTDGKEYLYNFGIAVTKNEAKQKLHALNVIKKLL